MLRARGTIGAGVLVIGAACVYACAQRAPTEPVGCPASIATEQKILNSPTSWEAVVETTNHPLLSVTFFDGPPEEKASLVYEAESQTATERTATWKLDSTPRGYWLTCGYDRTSVSLRKKLPSNVTRCEVVYEKAVTVGGLPVIKAINCK